jgi:hypothetical protein
LIGEEPMVIVVPILAWICALAFAALSIWRAPRPLTRGLIAGTLLHYSFVFPVGLLSLWAATGHIFFPAQAAAAIGWQTSPFQFEVGVANLGIGLAGLYAAFGGFEARLATNLVVAGFLGGARRRPYPRHRAGGQFRARQCRTDPVHGLPDTAGDFRIAVADAR